jgi:hypothetical protein
LTPSATVARLLGFRTLRAGAALWLPFVPVAAVLLAVAAMPFVGLQELESALFGVLGLVLVPPAVLFAAGVRWRRVAPVRSRSVVRVVLLGLLLLFFEVVWYRSFVDRPWWAVPVMGDPYAVGIGVAGIGVAWILTLAFLAGCRVSWRKTLRWVLVLPVALLVQALAFLVLFFPSSLQESAIIAAFLAAAPAGLYLAARVAPRHRRHRRLAILLLAVLWLTWLSAVTVGKDLPYWLGLACALAVLGGASLAWNHADALRRRTSAPNASGGHRYKGTAPFQDDPVDRRVFFGRETESRSLLHLVLAEPLVVLFAKSGLGKSSLINAGLVEPLRERNHLPMVVRLSDRRKGPVGSLLAGVRQAADEAAVERVGGEPADMVDLFSGAEFWSPNDELLHPVLVVDQFEELFTLHSPDARGDFIRQLAELMQGARQSRAGRAETPRLKVVLALREDFLAHLEELAHDIPAILHHRFRLGPLTRGAARAAIVGPAALADPAMSFTTDAFSFREEAVDQMLNFLARQRHGEGTISSDHVEPVQLQLVCQYLEEQVRRHQAAGRSSVVVTAADLGGEAQMQQVLEGFYDRTLGGIRGPLERWRVRRLCEKRLISAAGRRLTEDEEEICGRFRLSGERLRDLVDQRLLRAEPRLGGTFYELAHDRLVSPIRRSRARRRRRRTLLAATALVLVAANTGLWWAEEGRKGRERDVLRALAAVVPDPRDPRALRQRLQVEAGERLSRLEEEIADRRSSPEVLGAVAFTAERIARLYPETDLARRAELLQAQARLLLVAALGEPARDLLDGTRNPRQRIDAPGMASFFVQEHVVTERELRGFSGSERVVELDPFRPNEESSADVRWAQALAYAAWLGGSLPSGDQLQAAEKEIDVFLMEWCQEPSVQRDGDRWRRCRPVGRDAAAGLAFRVVWPAPVPLSEPDLPPVAR